MAVWMDPFSLCGPLLSPSGFWLSNSISNLPFPFLSYPASSPDHRPSILGPPPFSSPNPHLPHIHPQLLVVVQLMQSTAKLLADYYLLVSSYPRQHPSVEPLKPSFRSSCRQHRRRRCPPPVRRQGEQCPVGGASSKSKNPSCSSYGPHPSRASPPSRSGPFPPQPIEQKHLIPDETLGGEHIPSSATLLPNLPGSVCCLSPSDVIEPCSTAPSSPVCVASAANSFPASDPVSASVPAAFSCYVATPVSVPLLCPPGTSFNVGWHGSKVVKSNVISASDLAPNPAVSSFISSSPEVPLPPFDEKSQPLAPSAPKVKPRLGVLPTMRETICPSDALMSLFEKKSR